MLERVKGIEPSYEAWEAAVLPLNYTRIAADFSLMRADDGRLTAFSGAFAARRRAGTGTHRRRAK